MKKEKGIAKVGVVLIVIVVLLITVAVGAYMVRRTLIPSVRINNDGVEVNADGVNIKTGPGGASVSAPGVDIQTGADGASVSAPGVDIQTGAGGSSVNVTGDGASQEAGSGDYEEINSVLIFDASGSMAAQAQGGTRMSVAKNAVAKYVSKLGENVDLSVLAYGHKGNNTQAGKAESCSGIEEVYTFGPVNGGIVKSRVNSLNPNGWTPLASSLQKAGDILIQKSKSGEKMHVLLLSDGEETCGGNPVNVASQLKAKGIVIDVIGLNVTGATKTQLNSISVSGGGSYFSVEGSSDLNLVVDDMGSKVTTGTTTLEVNSDGSLKIRTDEADLDVTSGGDLKIDTKDVDLDVSGGDLDISF
ncbi:VWA domain-containing protein [Patescibacteria group bacterium]